MNDTDPADPALGRRRFLAAASTATAAIAGCSSGDDSGDGRATDATTGEAGTTTGTTAPTESETGDWTALYNGPGNTAYSPVGGPGADADRAWRWRPPDAREWLNPVATHAVVVHDGTPYVGASVSYAESVDSRVRLYDVAGGDGRVVYERDWGAPEVGADHTMPVVVDGRLVFGVAGQGGDAWGYAGVTPDGDDWFAEGSDRQWRRSHPPAALDGDAVVPTALGVYRKLDPGTGEFADEQFPTAFVPPTMHDGAQFRLTRDAVIRQPFDGQPTTLFDLADTDLVATRFQRPVYADGTVYAAAGRARLQSADSQTVPDSHRPHVVAVEADTGDPSWQRPLETGLTDPVEPSDGGDPYRVVLGVPVGVAVASETVYVVTNGGELRALARADGSRRWTARVAAPESVDESLSSASVAAGPDGAYVAVRDALVYVSAAGEAATLGTGDYDRATVSLAGDRLFVTDNGAVECYA